MAPRTTSPASAASWHSEPGHSEPWRNEWGDKPPAPDTGNPRRAFTMVEMLVVIGIMVLLITILLPVLSKFSRQAQRYKVGTLMNAISQGLEAYKGDFGDYPRLPFLAPPTGTNPYGEQADGFALLGLGLMGPGPRTNGPISGTGVETALLATPLFTSGVNYPAGTVVYTPAPNAPQTALFYVCISEFGSQGASLPPLPSGTTPPESSNTWSWFQQWADGNDGPGFRIRPGGSGRTWGPYLQADKVKMVGAAIVDANNNPILYFARAPGSPNILNYQPISTGGGTLAGAGGYVAAWWANAGNTNYPPPMYNFSDNSEFGYQAAGTQTTSFSTDARPMQALLGISATTFAAGGTFDNYVTPANGDSPKWTGPYILWSPGTAPTGLYGPNWTANSGGYVTPTSYTTQQQLSNGISKCENVFNFSFAQ